MGRCEKLKWNRRKLGMTQKDLADKIGISVSTISKLETDETAWATVRDTTDDVISDIIHKLGSWQCDLVSVMNNYKTIKNNDIGIDFCRKLEEKIISLGISQRKIAKILCVDPSYISKYRKNIKLWNSNKSRICLILRDFIDGKYDEKFIDVPCISASSNDNVVEKIMMSNTDSDVKKTLNDTIDILQSKLADDNCSCDDSKKYTRMIIGLCNGYLQRV